jgi:transporter family-2 protein
MIYILLALLAGTMLPVQAGVNAALRAQLGHPVLAGFASFTVGTLSLALYILAARLPWPTTPLGSIPLWQWTGGILGAVYLSLVILLAPRLGTATSFGLIISGQLIASLLLDHFGWLGIPQHSINPMRLLGLTLMIAGVVLVRKF